MKKLKPLIVFDADSVLLDWFKGFLEFLRTQNFNTSHVEKYVGTTQFVPTEEITKIECKKKNKEILAKFVESGFLSKLDCFQDDAVAILKELYKDYDFAVVTCIGESDDIVEQRTQNLIERHGDVFIRIACIDYGKSKENELRKLAEIRDIALYIDDRKKHLDEALNVGIKPALLSRGVKVTQDEKSKYNVISCLKEIRTILS